MKSFFTLSALVVALFTTAQSTNSNWKVTPVEQKVFIENKGQFDNLNDLPGTDILFGTESISNQILFTRNGLTYRLEERVGPTQAQREEREEEMEREIASGKKITHKEKEEREGKLIIRKDFVHMQWIGANPNAQVVALNTINSYFNYGIGNKSIGHLNGYKKILYKNLYPNIDVEYVLHPQGGIEYSFILYPGADPSKIKMGYSGTKNIGTDKKGSLLYPTIFGNIIEHAPSTFYADSKTPIGSKFVVSGNTVKFQVSNYDHTQKVIIDPWVQTPSFATQWDCIWECEKDASGNVYAIGGVMPMQLLKYDAAGTLQWTYSTPYDTSNSWLGTLATDNIGNSYVTRGSISGIQKIDNTGTLVWNNNGGGGSLGNSDEYWSISFNCDQTKLVVGGTTGAFAFPPVLQACIFDINTNNGNIITSKNVAIGSTFSFPPNVQEVRAITACGNGKYYFLTHDTIGYLHQNLSFCGGTGSFYKNTNSYDLGYKNENFRVNNTGIAAIKYYGGFVFTHRGDRLDKRDFATGSILASVAIPGGSFLTGLVNQVGNSGIDIDDCGNIYVGAQNQVVKFNQSLTQLATYATSFNVYDVQVSNGGNIIAAGSTGNSGSGARQGYVQSIAASACGILPITCCDASVCSAGPFCTTDAPVSLTQSTSGGIWSGPGVNTSTGLFTPSAAGQGTHYIRYTLGCGSDSIPITVNLCAALSACLESNSSITVSNGTGPYTWYHQVQQQNCSACLVGCAFPPGCATTVNTWQSFATGTNATPPDYPVKVIDNSGNELTINTSGSLSPCSASCSLTASATPTATTCGNNNGSATVSTTGGTPTAYSWSSGGSNASITNVAAGTYTVTVTAGACSATASAVVAPSIAISASTTKTDATCNNAGSATVNVTGGTATSYLWSNSGTSATISNLSAGTYTVTVTAGNCTATASAFVALTSGISASASSTNAGCTSTGTATAVVTGGTATAYLWSSGATTATASNLAAGNYTVTVTVGTCTATATTTVGSTSGITLSSSTTQSTCGSNNGSATVTLTSGSATAYNWSNGANTATANNLAAGTYTVTVTGNGGCSATASAQVTTTGAPVIATTTTNATCGANNGSATVNITSGTATAYNWSSGATTATAPNLGAGTYTVTVTGAGNCTVTASATVSATGAPTITTSTTNAGCIGNTGSATVTVISGTATNYSWSSGATTATASNLAAGTYTVTVTGTGICTVTASATVNAASGVAITASSTNTSCGNNNGTATISITAGNATNYSWSNGGSTSSLTGLAAGNYSVTVSDAGGCTATASVTIGGSGGTNVTITSPNTTICSSDSAQVCAPSGYVSYLWNTGATTTCITTRLAGNYYVTVTDNGNCTATSNHLAINVLPQPPVSISVSGDSLLAYNAVSYQWYLNGQAIPGATNPLLIANQPGSYTVKITGANGCTATSLPVVISVTDVPNVEKDAFSIYPNPNATGNWNLSVSKQWLGGICEIFDAQGRLVSRNEIQNQLSEINISVASGVYVLHLSNNNKNASYKLIKL